MPLDFRMLPWVPFDSAGSRSTGKRTLRAIAAAGSMILTAVFAGAAPGWNVVGALATAREEQTATLLPSGKVLVAGGFNGSSAIGSAELYDPKAHRQCLLQGAAAC